MFDFILFLMERVSLFQALFCVFFIFTLLTLSMNDKSFIANGMRVLSFFGCFLFLILEILTA